MKKLALIAALGLSVLASGASQALTQSPTFAVEITLMPTCQTATVSALNITYTGFATTLSQSGGNFTMTCNSNLAYSFALDIGSGGTATARQYVDQATGFPYTLSTPAAGTGNGSGQSLQILASLTGGTAFAFACADSAAGCTNSGSTNSTRTLTITY